MQDWCAAQGVALRYIQPGKPNQNAYIERFNKTYHIEVLDAYVFEGLDQVREITHEWLQRYNEERPHESLGNLPPSRYREAIESSAMSPFEVSLTGKATTTTSRSNCTPPPTNRY